MQINYPWFYAQTAVQIHVKAMYGIKRAPSEAEQYILWNWIVEMSPVL